MPAASAPPAPRASGDPLSPFPDFPDLPIALDHLQTLAVAIQPPGEENPFRADAFSQSLTDEIGYAIVGRGSVAMVFGGFLAGVLLLIVVLRGPRRREVLGWCAPVLALLAASVLLLLGERSRRAAEPTVAVGQLVDIAPGGQEASTRGLLAAYRTEGGPAAMGAERGGLFEIDQVGVKGQTRRLLLDDMDAWHWDGLTLPVGVRKAAFRYPVATEEPIRALARLTAVGIEGVLTTGPFRGASDAILLTPADRLLAVRLEANGLFRANGQDTLALDRFLADTLLSDRQQRRQELYRRFLAKPAAHLRGRNILLAWADPVEMHFQLSAGAKTVGDALLIVPLELRPPAADTRVTIPAALVPAQRIQDGIATRVTREFSQASEQHLRFQLPAAALPMQIERVRLAVRIDAASRPVTVSAREGEAFTEVHRVESPLDTVHVEIAEPRLLTLDERGGLHLRLTVGNPHGDKKGPEPNDDKWTLRSIELEVTGRTLPER